MSPAQLALLVFVSFACALAWRQWALRRAVLDHPGQRSSHAVATVRGGGIGIVLALLLAWALGWIDGQWNRALVLSLALMALVGLLDDLRGLPASVKFAGQCLAISPLLWAIVRESTGTGPLVFADMAALVPATLAAGVLLFFVNAWNFMDGIDGIAALAAIAVAAVAWMAGVEPLWAAALLAASLGFLPLNLPRARLFMGDCGSHVLGLGIGLLVLDGIGGGLVSLVVLAATAPFSVDVLATLGRRLLDREPLASAHRRHLYQLLVRSGYSHPGVALAYAFMMLAMGAGMAWIEPMPTTAWLLVAAGHGLLLLAWCVLHPRLERRLAAGGNA